MEDGLKDVALILVGGRAPEPLAGVAADGPLAAPARLGVVHLAATTHAAHGRYEMPRSHHERGVH